jgi:hypothetical protein
VNPGITQASSGSSNSSYSPAYWAGACAAVAATGYLAYKRYNSWQENRRQSQLQEAFFKKLEDALLYSFVPNKDIQRMDAPLSTEIFCKKAYFYAIADQVLTTVLRSQPDRDLERICSELTDIVTQLYMQNENAQILETVVSQTGQKHYSLKPKQQFQSPCKRQQLSAFEEEMVKTMANYLRLYYKPTNMMNATEKAQKAKIKEVLERVIGKMSLTREKTVGYNIFVRSSVIQALKELFNINSF